MEFLLLPTHRGDPEKVIQVPTTPYVCTERYDGGSWLSYPARNGMAERFKEGRFDILVYERYEKNNPMPIKEKESFFQTWLYFGLIAELLGANSKDKTRDPTAKELIKTIYKKTVVEDGDKISVKLDTAILDEFLDLGRARMSPDPQVRREHYEHMVQCLDCVHMLISTVPNDFNWSVKSSIAALGELFTIIMQTVLRALEAPTDFSRMWGVRFLNDEAKASMREHGWCRSDIARAEAKYDKVQTLYIARMLDKSHPIRDHSQCTDASCYAHQNNMSQYDVQHQKLSCSCTELVMEEESLLSMVLEEGHYPLLKFEGQMDNLSCEPVRSGSQPYVAISHVWSDGLGNAEANALPKCRLYHLQKLVDAIADADSGTTPNKKERYLIWLDTLCCPAKPGIGKDTSIEKMRVVYEKAKYVLVLDAGLMAYDSESQDSSEIVFRIFTSSWMRRLWTLQEAALASCLFFQFADKAVNLVDVLRRTWSKAASSMQYVTFQPDLIRETKGIAAFFHSPTPLEFADSLDNLDHSLQYRGVSVPSDEPLCIATLMSLKLEDIVELETQELRMAKVWDIIMTKNGGIPSQIIFFEEEKLSQPGWRWAPKTLLNTQRGMRPLKTRVIRWNDTNIAIREHPYGLRVKYPGVQIFVKSDYGDGKPRNPWIGAPRLGEDWILYHSLDDGRWYKIADTKLMVLSSSWKTDEERREHNKRELFPLHEVANTGRSVLVLNNLPGMKEALFAEKTSDKDDLVEEEAIAVNTRLNTIVQDLGEESYIYDVVEKLALAVRADEVTDKHLDLCQRLKIDENTASERFKDLLANHEEFIASTASVKGKVQEKLAQAVAEDEEFVRLINKFWDESYQRDFWVVIRNFFHHDYVGKRTGEQQQWWID
ncbi:uncharacterized protein LY89DRAFT_680318 [Mollisia scopiformis]|uniref:Heterokaryon incompatibility domain-containing protein n=1 Tax=Mollisia scopiformis TaxID=149040 RepID=A0A194XV57_MOLSC|nr:uncharacterized protein LY89DRAFT_680318 [Mollisia scopiformis]KUJ23592.1 hypothetical protein LY89DRAFT_680318 [Mollisia scopiformis]